MKSFKEFIKEDRGSLLHHFYINNNLKHIKQHYKKNVDADNDSDVDNLEKTPDEVTGTEKKNLTPILLKKYKKEKQHTKIGLAYK